MSLSNDKNSNKVIQAMVIASSKLVRFAGENISDYFKQYKVSLINVLPAEKHGQDSISLVLLGKEEDIRLSLNDLKKNYILKEVGYESSPAKSVPLSIKGYLSDMEDDFRFEKIFSYCSKEYLDYCKLNNLKPHPEVIESIS